MDTLHIRYAFRLSGEREEIFDLALDETDLHLTGDMPENLPGWTDLAFHQCPHCSLDMATHARCPVASRLADPVKRFADILSYDEVQVDVSMEERHITQTTSAQIGIGSLMGLIMATSGCPHLDYFRPMARFHLPFSDDRETVYRSVSTYLLGQYFLEQTGGEPDYTLEGLKTIYKNVKTVNAYILERLRTATEKDSSLNAVIALDLFAEAVLFGLEEGIEDIRYLFDPYVEHLPHTP